MLKGMSNNRKTRLEWVENEKEPFTSVVNGSF